MRILSSSNRPFRTAKTKRQFRANYEQRKSKNSSTVLMRIKSLLFWRVRKLKDFDSARTKDEG